MAQARKSTGRPFPLQRQPAALQPAGVRATTVLDLFGRQRGVVTRDQLYALGLSRRTVARRVADGVWIPHGRSVLVRRGTEDTLATRSRVAALRVPGSVLTGPSAAALLGRGPWEGVDIGGLPWLVARYRPAVAARFLAHPGMDFRLVDGLRVARRDLAVVDLLRLLPLDSARTVAYRTVQIGLLDVAGLTEHHRRLQHCAGAGQLRSLLHDLSSGSHADSERLLVELLRGAGISGWHVNHPIPLGGGEVRGDVVFPDHRLVVEIDGRAWHTDPQRFQADRSRQNRLVRAGWTVLRFTWEDLVERPRRLVAEIKACLR